jgi:diguanylate cyclase (GGDEF)-like protein
LASKKPLAPITALQRSGLRSMLFEHYPDGIAITDVRGRVIDSNPALTRITGYSLGELIDKNLFCPLAASYGRTLYRAIRRSITRTGYWHGDVPPMFFRGHLRSHSLRIHAILDELRNTIALSWTLIDEASLSDKHRELAHLAHHDPLTGLPNRRSLMSRLDSLLGRPGSETRGAVLYLDLDGFKQVNDTAGHRVGDKLLQAVAARIKARIRHTDMLARVGGDEFVIVLEQIVDEHDAVAVAEQIIEQLRTPFEQADGSVYRIGASVGIALSQPNRLSAELFIDQADRALYAAKRAGKGICRFLD